MKVLFEKHISLRKPPVGLKEEDRELFIHEFHKEIREAHVLELTHANINGMVIRQKDAQRKYNEYSQLHGMRSSTLLERIQMKFRSPIVLESGVWIIDNWSKGYFHWMADALPRLILSESVSPSVPVILPEEYQSEEYAIESLRIMGKEIIFFSYSRPLLVHELILPSHAANTGNYNRDLLTSLRTRFIAIEEKEVYRRIYISRQKAKIRKISNESQVQDILKSFNYEIHFFEEYAFSTQLDILSQTESLVGLHGGGLTNMLFMPEGGKVLEFRRAGDSHNNCYFSMSSELGHEYYYLLNKGNSVDTHKVEVQVDLEALVEALQKIHS